MYQTTDNNKIIKATAYAGYIQSNKTDDMFGFLKTSSMSNGITHWHMSLHSIMWFSQINNGVSQRVSVIVMTSVNFMSKRKQCNIVFKQITRKSILKNIPEKEPIYSNGKANKLTKHSYLSL